MRTAWWAVVGTDQAGAATNVRVVGEAKASRARSVRARPGGTRGYARRVERDPQIKLEPAVGAALDTLVAGIAGLIIDVLASAELDETICWVCLYPGQEEGLDALPVIYAGRASDRQRLVDEGLEHWSAVWNPEAMRDGEDVVHPTYADGVDHYVEYGPELVAAWTIVRDAIQEVCLSPEHWVYRQVAHDLNRRQLPLPASDDLAVWVFEFDCSEGELLDQFETVLRPATFGMLADAGLISATPESFDPEFLQSHLDAHDPFADLRRAAAADQPPAFSQDTAAGIAYLALIPGAELADRTSVGTENDSLDLSLEYDSRGRLAGVGFENATRRAPPELLAGTSPLAIRDGTRARPGTTLVLADRGDDAIADSHDFSEDVAYDCWITLDIDRAGHLVAIRFRERRCVPPALRAL